MQNIKFVTHFKEKMIIILNCFLSLKLEAHVGLMHYVHQKLLFFMRCLFLFFLNIRKFCSHKLINLTHYMFTMDTSQTPNTTTLDFSFKKMYKL